MEGDTYLGAQPHASEPPEANKTVKIRDSDLVPTFLLPRVDHDAEFLVKAESKYLVR